MAHPERFNRKFHADLDTPGFLSAEDKVKIESLGVITSLSDLPSPSNGVITLEDNATYTFQGTVDLLGNRLVAGQNTTINGGSSENTKIISTGLSSSTALITSEYSLPMKFITLEHGTLFDLDANGNSDQAIDWIGVNFINSSTIGTIANYSNVILNACAFLNSGGMIFDGSIGTVGFSETLFDAASGTTILSLPETLTITRRFRIIYSAFVVLSGETGISVSASATIPNEGYILDTVNFGGGGTYISGVNETSNKSLFTTCKGIVNSGSIGSLYMSNNATATVILGIGTPVKIAGTTTLDSSTKKFSHSNNRLTYTGSFQRTFKVTSICTFSSGSNNQIGVYVAKNGTVIDSSETYATANSAGRLENVYVQAIIELSENDYIEIFIENNTSITNITVESLSVIIVTED